MEKLKLFMLLLGCKPKGRHIEQHDVFFGVAESVKDLVPDIIKFWPEANGNIHLDAYREVANVDGYTITVHEKKPGTTSGAGKMKLFFINLGGYKQNEFDEFHYKVLSIQEDKGMAVEVAKQTAFYQHTKFPGANSHIDDKYGVDVDDIFQIEDVLPPDVKEKYFLEIMESKSPGTDKLYLGYFKLDKL
ncbi:MAG TPA: DUF1543 domain-containing protein [Sphingobacteriaceae bacterium]